MTTTPKKTPALDSRWLRLGKAIRAAGAHDDWSLWVAIARTPSADLRAAYVGCFGT